MRKKISIGIIIASFVIMICLPWIIWLILGKVTDSPDFENRNHKEFPSFSIDNYCDYSTEFNSYVDDNLPFRQYLILANSAIDYFIFDKSASPKVTLGKDKWLFYSDVDDGDPINFYKGYNLYTEEEMQIILQRCLDMQEYVESQGKEFVFFIAPNKELIYSEEMLDYYGKPAEYNRTTQIVDCLRNNTDIRVVYPYEELMEAKRKLPYPIYYVTDTHWNQIGGYIGARALLRELGIDIPDITDELISIEKGENRAGDLASMINLYTYMEPFDNEYIVTGYDNHNLTNLENDFFGATVFEATGADQRKIYMCRDSFATAMTDSFCSQFNSCYLRHINSYTTEDFLQQDADVFVLEMVERYTDSLFWFDMRYR